MNTILKRAIKTTLTGAVLTAASTNAHAADAVPVFSFLWDNNQNQIMQAGGSITDTDGTSNQNSYTDNPSLANSAWGHAGAWYSFMTHEAADTTISVSSDALGTLAPAFTVWASGSSSFDGGTTDSFETSNITGGNVPHDFNVTGALGDDGTNWMRAGGGGNLLETLGYANSGIGHSANETDWGETIAHGAHDVSLTNLFENGITGSVAPGYAELVFTDLQPGWYAIFVGGADSSLPGGGYDLTVNSSVSSVPVPGAVYLFGSAMLGLISAGRKKRNQQA